MRRTQQTSVVGRTKLLASTRELLQDTRLVTLVGPGGVGKTRLAQETARLYDDETGDGRVALAYLGDADTLDALNQEVNAALGIEDGAQDAWIDHLRDSDALLVLDNCEHLLDPVRDLLATLLDESPKLRVLTTSRLYLELPNEHIVRVPPLDLPDDTALSNLHTEQSDALRLLLERSAAAGRTITDDDDWDALVQLARWSGGLPLVLELIAVRLGGGMSPRSILERLAGGLLLSANRSMRVQPHHRKLQQVIDRSYDLCTEPERRLWARISVFHGGFELDSVEAVCSGGGIAQPEIIDLLDGLVRQSLIGTTPEGRYQQLQPLREYGQRRLEALGEQASVHDAHFAYFEQLAADAAAQWFGRDEMKWLARVRHEMPNFRAAVQYCARTPSQAERGLVMATNLGSLRVCFFHEMYDEFGEWLERLLQLTPATPSLRRINAAAMLGWISLRQSAHTQAKAQLEHCRELAVQRGGPEPAVVTFLDGAYKLAIGSAESVDLLATACEAFAAEGSKSAGDLATAKLIRTLAACFLADKETALLVSEDCMAEPESAGAEWAASWAALAKGFVPLFDGHPDIAAQMFQDTLTTQLKFGDRWGAVWCTELIGWATAKLALQRHSSATNLLYTAAELLGGASCLRDDIGVTIFNLAPFVREREKIKTTILRRLGSTAFSEAYHRGTHITTEQVYTLALQSQDKPMSGINLDSLSRRRREVAELVANGLENGQIAKRLQLSVRTVENHMSAIFATLNVSNRAQVAAWVTEQLNKPQ